MPSAAPVPEAPATAAPGAGYPEVQGFDMAAVEEALLRRWEADRTFERSVEIREGAEPFVFYEGPPTANGKPGIHHVMARTIKDLFCRYRTMKGYRVDRKAGWDTHGLPVEIEVEKALGLEGRHQVEEYGIAEYNAACRTSVLKYKDLWDSLTRRMGYWVDLDAPYVTFENSYIESVWALLKRISERQTEDGEGFLYRGHKIQWYSPGSGTVLSSHEVSLGYKEIQDPSIYVRFPVVNESGGADASLLVWTTTPWTMPSNAAAAVGPKIPYVRVRVTKDGESEVLYVAKARMEILDGEVEVLEELTGADLVGMRYRPPFDVFADHEEAASAWRIVPADFVTTDDGTGIVHLAPAFGADDYLTAQREGFPAFNPIDAAGRFTDAVPLVAGEWFKDADKALARDMRERGLLYRHETYLHNYPHDWRKGTPLMSYPVESWFVRTTAIRDRLIALNDTINWQPEGIGSGRFGQWLENNVDWALSRMRFWGTPLPIWVSDQDPEHFEVIGSIEELKAKAGGEIPAEARNPETGELDLHRPFVDAVTWPDGRGGTMRRVPDLIDVWFDSGAMPFAQWHYPFENQDAFRRNFPADFIAEGVDQTRGWFYTLHAIAALVEDSVAYKNVVVNGLVLDEHGEKMSKSKGNTVDPFATIEAHGADPVRWTMMSNSAPWESLRFSDRAIEETRRRLFGTLTNTYNFFATYANLDGFSYDAASRIAVADRAELDRWILSRLQGTVRTVDEALDAYHPTQAARAVEAFVEELSNWYVRRSRRRFWKNDDRQDQQAGYQTLYESLLTVAQLMAPIAPFFSEWLWQSLAAGRPDLPDSVHLSDFPAPQAAAEDAALEGRMALARQVVSATLALRNEARLNVRQPLSAIGVVVGSGGADEADLRAVEAIILEEVNVKRLDAIASGSGLVEKTAKPNFKALGRRLGKQMKAATAAIRALTTDEIEAYERDGAITLDLDGAPTTFEAGDIEVTSAGVEGRLVGQESGPAGVVTVALETALTPELEAEGLARELINRIQNARKAAGFDVSDRIEVFFQAPDTVADAARVHEDAIRAETLALRLEAGGAPGAASVHESDINGHPVTLALCRAGMTGDVPAA